MSAARHMIALLKSHLEGDDKEFLSVAMQAAAHEARLGHASIAQQLRDLIDEAKSRSTAVQSRPGNLSFLSREANSPTYFWFKRPVFGSAIWRYLMFWRND